MYNRKHYDNNITKAYYSNTVLRNIEIKFYQMCMTVVRLVPITFIFIFLFIDYMCLCSAYFIKH